MAAAAAATQRGIVCELAPQRVAVPRADPRPAAAVAAVPRIQAADPSPAGARIVLQPRVTNLRSYGSGAGLGFAVVVAPTRRVQGAGGDDPSPFFASLADYIESYRRSQDFETLSGRLAMLAFAGAVTAEVVTGSSVFPKLDLGEMAEAAGACLGVVACAAGLAWATSVRTRIGRMFTLGCNSVVDALIDSLVDGLFFDSDPTDWTDDL